MTRTSMICAIAVFFAALSVSRTGSAQTPHGSKSPDFPGNRYVTGSVSCKDWTEIPPTAMVHVELIDLSIKDQQKSVMGEDTIWTAGIKPPVTFRIPYDHTRIDQTHTYIIRARITDGEKTLFAGSSTSHVLTKGAPITIEIKVTPVSILYKQ